MSLTDRAGLDAARRAALAHGLDALATLEDVMRWALAQQPPCVVTDIVVQDEYTHDVVLSYGPHWLVFDTT